VRIDTLTYNNVQTQGAYRRAWLRQHSSQHLEQCAALMLHALKQRQASASRSVLVLGAGACTEVPLNDLAYASDEVVLADLDLAAMQQGRDELTASALRKRVRLLQCDISGEISLNLNRLIKQQPWATLVPQSAQAVFDVAARCLEQCAVSDPPQIHGLGTGEFGVVISSLVLSQLFSYPLLDILDHVQHLAPGYLGEQERHRHYQEASQAFRVRVIQAHLHLLHELLDVGGIVVLLSDLRGFVFDVYGTDHDAEHRRMMPIVPRTFPELVREHFEVIEEAHWEWLTDLPQEGKLGRGYEVVGYVLSLSK
jgi:predicted RNA methylase